MKKFTQQELMIAHNISRASADNKDAKAASEAKIVEPVDPRRKAEPFDSNIHPFGSNDNNRRVAERIARSQAELTTVGKVALSPAEAAAAALNAADNFEDDEPKQLSDDEQKRVADKQTADGLNAKQTADAKKESLRILTLPDDNPEKIAYLAASALQPPAPVSPPAWKANA